MKIRLNLTGIEYIYELEQVEKLPNLKDLNPNAKPNLYHLTTTDELWVNNKGDSGYFTKVGKITTGEHLPNIHNAFTNQLYFQKTLDVIISLMIMKNGMIVITT
jgi:hypothetical protein